MAEYFKSSSTAEVPAGDKEQHAEAGIVIPHDRRPRLQPTELHWIIRLLQVSHTADERAVVSYLCLHRLSGAKVAERTGLTQERIGEVLDGVKRRLDAALERKHRDETLEKAGVKP